MIPFPHRNCRLATGCPPSHGGNAGSEISQGPQRNSIGDRSRLCACPSFGQYTALDIDRQRSTSPHGAIAVIGREPMVTITDGASDFRLIT